MLLSTGSFFQRVVVGSDLHLSKMTSENVPLSSTSSLDRAPEMPLAQGKSGQVL